RAIAALRYSAAPFDESDRRRVINAELSLEAGLWCFLARQLHHQRMNLQLDAIDLVGRELMFVVKLDASIDGCMHDDTAGERLVRVLRNLVRLAEFPRDVVVIVTRADEVDPPVFCFEALLPACKRQ